MVRPRKHSVIVLAATLMLMAAPALGQDEAAPEMAEPDIVVSGIDYAFVGLPSSVPVGTTLGFTNDGTEVHEMAIVKINDETTPLEELMAMPDEETEAISEFVGFTSAFPGMSGDTTIAVDAPGRYVALCFIPQGMDPAIFEQFGIDPANPPEDPAELPPEAQELLASLESNPPHMDLGMIQEFTVTDEGTGVGPLPEGSDVGDEDMDDADATGDDSSE